MNVRGSRRLIKYGKLTLDPDASAAATLPAIAEPCAAYWQSALNERRRLAVMPECVTRRLWDGLEERATFTVGLAHAYVYSIPKG